MKYRLNAIPADLPEEFLVDGYQLAKSVVPIVSGIIDNVLSNAGKKLARISGYDELSEESKQFMHEIIYMLMLEQLSNTFEKKVMLSPGEQHLAQHAAQREISDCSTFVKIINKVSLEDIKNAVIAETETEAKRIILQQLKDSTSKLPTPLSWESMKIANPFEPKK